MKIKFLDERLLLNYYKNLDIMISEINSAQAEVLIQVT